MFTAACLCSCYIGADAKPRRQERKTALKVFKYIKNEDIDKLVDLFAEDTKDNYDVEDEGIVYKKLIYCHIIVDEDKDMVGINAFELIDSDGESVAVVGGY